MLFGVSFILASVDGGDGEKEHEHDGQHGARGFAAQVTAESQTPTKTKQTKVFKRTCA